MGSIEKRLEQRLREEVRKAGGMALKLPAGILMGIPDRICLLPSGRALFVELKDTGVKPTPRQESMHARLRAIGFDVTVIDSPEKLQAWILKNL